MNARKEDLGDIKVRSVALPRDGGVLNPATKGKYTLFHTNVAKRIKAEAARIKAEAAVQQAPAAPLVAFQPRARGKA